MIIIWQLNMKWSHPIRGSSLSKSNWNCWKTPRDSEEDDSMSMIYPESLTHFSMFQNVHVVMRTQNSLTCFKAALSLGWRRDSLWLEHVADILRTQHLPKTLAYKSQGQTFVCSREFLLGSGLELHRPDPTCMIEDKTGFPLPQRVYMSNI